MISWVLSCFSCLGAVRGAGLFPTDGPSVYSLLPLTALIWSKDKIAAGWISLSESSLCRLPGAGCWITANELPLPCWFGGSMCSDLEFWQSVGTWHASEILRGNQTWKKQREKINDRKYFWGEKTLSSHKLPKPPGNDLLHQRITVMLGSWTEFNSKGGRGPHHRRRM